MLWAADETALDLFARRPTRGFLTRLAFLDAPVSCDATGGFQPRHVVEVSGDAAAPLTLALLHVVAAFLTRDALSPVVDGRDARAEDEHQKVFVFDHECELAAPLLLRIVSDKLRPAFPDDHAARLALARRLLARVVVFHCRDSFQWLATINKLHFDLLEAPPGPCLIVIHSVGSFHAIDKMVAKSAGSGLALADQVFLILKQFIRHHSPIVFASKLTQSKAKAAWDTPEYMPTSWSRQVSKRIQLRLAPVAVDQEGTRDENCFEARSFSQGKSRMLSFRVDGLALSEETNQDDSLDFSSSLPVRETERTPTIAIAEADTNAAQLWKH